MPSPAGAVHRSTPRRAECVPAGVPLFASDAGITLPRIAAPPCGEGRSEARLSDRKSSKRRREQAKRAAREQRKRDADRRRFAMLRRRDDDDRRKHMRELDDRTPLKPSVADLVLGADAVRELDDRIRKDAGK